MLRVHINVQLPQDLRSKLEAEIQKLTSITFKKKIIGADNLYVFSTKSTI
jgi:hypothetical protein